MELSKAQIYQLPKHYKIHLINGITGTKAANLIGTKDCEGQENLGVFSSVIHLGSDPALIGFVLRQGNVPRHTFENILQQQLYTINHIHSGIYAQAHQTSAKFPKSVSEFDAVGLTPQYIDGLDVPFVLEAKIKMALSLQEVVEIKSNGTRLIIGEIIYLIAPDDCVYKHGFIDLQKAESMSISGLDAYYDLSFNSRLAYAEEGKALSKISKNSNGKQA